jgi:mannose-6-phosphate isomerase
MEPIFPKPNYLSTIWAGNRLSTIRGLNPEKPIGISREVCVYKGVENIVEGGEFDGMNLRTLIDEHHDEIMGDDPEHEMIRIAYMDSVDDLSIQVHPGEEYAAKVGDREKSESWYILDADLGAYVVAGTTAMSKEELVKASETDSISDYAIHLPVKKGDCIVIPAGTLHACGKNLLAIEVGSFGGITYRICDYGRGRELNIERAMDVLDLSSHPAVHHLPKKTSGDDRAIVSNAMSHRLFAADVIDIAEKWSETKGNTYQVLTAVEGSFELVVDGRNWPLPYTRTVIIPACISAFIVVGNGRILRSYRPLAA